jgi:hypothetical protein
MFKTFFLTSHKIAGMETTITIKKNKPAFKALILLARELEKNDHTSISISEGNKQKQNFDLITPTDNNVDPFVFFDQLTDFPTLDELRKQAWPKSS